MVEGKEFAFACAVKHHYSGDIAVLYISDVYDINASLNVPTGERMWASFICLVSQDRHRCPLAAIAEEPATAFSCLEYSVEDVYVRMRRTYKEGKSTAPSPATFEWNTYSVARFSISNS